MHLLVDISCHGFGHLAISAPVLNRLAEREKDVELTIRSGLPERNLRERIQVPFDLIPEASDFGFVMLDATRVDLPATAKRYRSFHENWPERIQSEANQLRALGVDGVLTNVSYLPLAGAKAAGIPAMAICSLNWADLFHHFFVSNPEETDWAARIHAEMVLAYQAANGFLRITPGMPMTTLNNVMPIGVIAAMGQKHDLQTSPSERLVLVAMGGIQHRLPVENWPVLQGVRWLVPSAWSVEHPNATAFESLGLSFTDLLASVDVVVTKPGYGTFTEAVNQGTPVIYQRRDDWPEQACLIAWLEQAGVGIEVSEQALQLGQIEALIDLACTTSKKPPPKNIGAEQAVDCLIKAFWKLS